MNVPVTPDGRLTFEDGVSAGGKYVELRAERDVIGLISNCPQLEQPLQCVQSDADRSSYLVSPRIRRGRRKMSLEVVG